MRTSSRIRRSLVPCALAACLCAPPATAIDFNAAYKIAGGRAQPGGSVAAPFTIRSSWQVQGYSFSLDFDETVLRAEEVEIVWQKPNGSSYSYARFAIDNDDATEGSGGIDEGYITGGVVFDLVFPTALPTDADVEVLRFHFQVDPDTTANQAVLRFQDGGVNDSGRAEVNKVTAPGRSLEPETFPADVLLNGVVEVLPDIFIFTRGETNGDERIDLSDAQTMLNWLFLGGAAPSCFDAADVNDDGTIDLSDPTRLLGFLFLGESAPPAPFPGAGADPTADRIGCYYRDSAP